jgi:hypothetical protein
MMRRECSATIRKAQSLTLLTLEATSLITRTMATTRVRCFSCAHFTRDSALTKIVWRAGGGRGFNRFKRGRYEGDYGHRGARPPKPQTDSICVARIPQELNTISQLNAHFQKFGNIVNIQVWLMV